MEMHVAEAVFTRLQAGEEVPVTNPRNGVQFRIKAKEACGLTGYGVIPEGRKRPSSYPIMSAARVLEWLCNLEA